MQVIAAHLKHIQIQREPLTQHVNTENVKFFTWNSPKIYSILEVVLNLNHRRKGNSTGLPAGVSLSHKQQCSPLSTAMVKYF